MTYTLISHLPSRGGWEESYMKKAYIMPAMQVEEAQAAQMLAESLSINTDSGQTVDGGQALTKEDNGWNIWNDEE